MKKDEIFGAAVLFLFGALTTILSLGMEIGTFRTAGTGMFPLCLGILLMILSGLFISKLLLQNGKIMVKRELAFEIPGATKQMIFFLGAMVLATLFFNRLGYLFISFLMMAALLRILGMKKWTLNILLSFMVAVACYFLFVQWLQIPLPKGFIGL